MAGVLDWLFGPGAASAPESGVAGDRGLVTLHAGGDLLIAVAFLSISLALVRFMRRRGDVQFNWIFGMFAAFLLLSALSHMLAVVTVWLPWYGLDGVLKLVTAGVCVATGVVIWPLIPRVVALPSPQQYASANRRLQKAMDALERSNAELESRVAERTAELEEASLQLETRRREAERAAEERRVMLREMHHRTGNNLQVISSFVGLTLRGVKDPAAANAIREIRARLAAITDVNRLLLHSDTFAKGRADEYVQRLTDDLKETLLPPGSQIRIATELEPLELTADQLTYLGLVAVELITNSVKYAYPAGAPGEVRVRLVADGKDHMFEVADDGAGFDPALVKGSAGAGATIVRQFALRLNATVEQLAAPGRGVSVRLMLHPAENGEPKAGPAGGPA